MKSRLMAKLASSSALMSASAARLRIWLTEDLISSVLWNESTSCSQRLDPSRKVKARPNSTRAGGPAKGAPFASGFSLKPENTSQKD